MESQSQSSVAGEGKCCKTDGCVNKISLTQITGYCRHCLDSRVVECSGPDCHEVIMKMLDGTFREGISCGTCGEWCCEQECADQCCDTVCPAVMAVEIKTEPLIPVCWACEDTEDVDPETKLCKICVTYKFCKTDSCKTVIPSGAYDYCGECLEDRMECKARECYETIPNTTYAAIPGIGFHCDTCGEWCCEQSCADRCCNPVYKADLQRRCAEIMGCAISEPTLCEGSLKRKCEEEEEPTSKRVCVEDDNDCVLMYEVSSDGEVNWSGRFPVTCNA